MKQVERLPKHLDPDAFYLLLVEDESQFSDQLLPLIQAVLLEEHQVESEDIYAFRVKSREKALEYINAMNAISVRDGRFPKRMVGRGFDAVFLDLKVFDRDVGGDRTPRAEYGFAVIERLAEDDIDWAGSLVVITQMGQESEILEWKRNHNDRLERSQWRRPVVDDFLWKEFILASGTGDQPDGKKAIVIDSKGADLTRAKLRRHLVPIARYAKRARTWDPPGYFLGAEMLRILKDLVVLAMTARSASSWPLPKLLILGEAGSGKGVLARAYWQILNYLDSVHDESGTASTGGKTPKRSFMKLNCASLTALGEGGKMRLFGTAREKIGEFPAQAGVFEDATEYADGKEGGLAKQLKNKAITALIAKGGVVFLDEFTELEPNLQATILNCLQEGEINRQFETYTIPIGCSVVLATNSEIGAVLGSGEELAQGKDTERRVRADLIDRIPFLIQIPSLLDRSEDVEQFICLKASERQARITESVAIDPSARELINRAVKLGWLRSFRHLEQIAEVGNGETRITDGNLKWLRTKLMALRVSDSGLEDKPSAYSIQEKLMALGLSGLGFPTNLPQKTIEAIEVMFETLLKGEGKICIKTLSVDEETKNRIGLLARCISKGVKVQIFESYGATKQHTSQAAKRVGVKLDGNQDAVRDIVGYLSKDK